MAIFDRVTIIELEPIHHTEFSGGSQRLDLTPVGSCLFLPGTDAAGPQPPCLLVRSTADRTWSARGTYSDAQSGRRHRMKPVEQNLVALYVAKTGRAIPVEPSPRTPTSPPPGSRGQQDSVHPR